MGGYMGGSDTWGVLAHEYRSKANCGSRYTYNGAFHYGAFHFDVEKRTVRLFWES